MPASFPLVSLIVPVYNSLPFLPACLSSILSQTWPQLELWFIDDGSTDGSAAYLDSLPALISENNRSRQLHILHQKNAGAAAARNRGIREATGEFLLFMDNDDLLEEDYVEQLVRRLLAQPEADLLVAGYHRTAEDGRILHTQRPTSQPWSKFRFVAPWARILRRRFVLDNKLLFGNFPLGEDSFFSVTSYLCSPCVAVTDYAGYHWIDHPASVSNTLQRRSDLTDATELTDALLTRNEQQRGENRLLLEYFCIKYLVWHLTFIAGRASSDLLRDTCDRYFSWLSRQLPAYQRHPLLSPLAPAGERLSVRLTVFFLTLSPMRLKRLLLALYGSFSS